MESFSKNSELFSVHTSNCSHHQAQLCVLLLLVTPDTANIYLALLELFSLNIRTLCDNRIAKYYGILKNPSPDHSIT